MTAEHRAEVHALRQELADIQDLLNQAMEQLTAAGTALREHLRRGITASAVLGRLEEILGPLPPLPGTPPLPEEAPPPPIVALLRVPHWEKPSADIEETRRRMAELRSRLRELGRRPRAA